MKTDVAFLRFGRLRTGRGAAAIGLVLGLAAVIGCSSGSGSSSGRPPAGSGEQSTATPRSTPTILAVDPETLRLLRGDWSPRPFALSVEAIAVVDRVCRTTRDDRLEGYVLAVVDARGAEIVNAFYVGGRGGNYACEGLWIDPLGQLQPGGFGSGTDPSDAVPRPSPDEVIAWYGTHQEAPRATIASAGLVGSNITEVRFTAEGKSPIVATIMNGWFAVWLPDDWPRLVLRGYDGDGVEIFATTAW